MERTGHEGVVLHGVAEHDQLACADALAVGRGLGGGLDDAGHFQHGIHVDARAREPTFTDEHTLSVTDSACGMESISL